MFKILKVELNGIKNVNHGVIDFRIKKEVKGKSDIENVIGIYGQNGSGKTSVIDCFLILSSLVSGFQTEKPGAITYFDFLVNKFNNDSNVKYSFLYEDNLGKRFFIDYQVFIRRMDNY